VYKIAKMQRKDFISFQIFYW